MDTGNLYGTVVDEQGTGLAIVTVTLTGGGDAPSTQVTDAEGNFRFLSLQPGSYRLKAELEGFSTTESPNIKISAGPYTEIRVTLPPAAE